MSMKKLAAVILALTLVLSLFSGAVAEEKKYTIGFSNVWVGNTYGIQCVNELEAFLQSNPQVEEYYIYNADNDVNKQISDIEDLIAKGVDMIILQPISAESVAAVVEEAYDAGIVWWIPPRLWPTRPTPITCPWWPRTTTSATSA